MNSWQRENDLQRIVFAVLAGLFVLLVASVAAFLFLASMGIVSEAQLGTSWIVTRELFTALDVMSWFERFGVASAALLFGVVVLFAFVRAALARGRRSPLHLIEIGEPGLVAIDTRGIETIAVQAALGVRGVLDASAQVRGNGLIIRRLDVGITVLPGSDVKSAGINARDAVRDALEHLVGVEPGDVVVKAQVLAAGNVARVL